MQKIRVRKASQKVLEKYKRRKVLRTLRKSKKTDNSYIPAGFTTKSVPDIDFNFEPVHVPMTITDESKNLVIRLICKKHEDCL